MKYWDAAPTVDPKQAVIGSLIVLIKHIVECSPTYNCDSDCFGNISFAVPRTTRVGTHVVCISTVDLQKGHSIIIFLHHIGSPVIIPGVVWPWVPTGSALQLHTGTTVNFKVVKLQYLRWWI